MPPELNFDVHWRVPVGCGWSGFFTEVALGFIPGLHERGVSVKFISGQCDESFLSGLETADAAAYRATWVAESTLTQAQTAASLICPTVSPAHLPNRIPSKRWRNAEHCTGHT